MIITINTDELEEGLMVTGRNPVGAEAKLIRAGVHSFTNHNAMTVRKNGNWGIAEAEPPVSRVTSIEHYEELMNKGYLVRFYRHRYLTPEQHKQAAEYFVENLLGLRYPRKRRMVLLALPICNAIIDKIKKAPPMRLTWCSQLDKKAYLSVDPDCLDGVDGKKKELFTPKTFENRIMFGIFQDITEKIVTSVRSTK